MALKPAEHQPRAHAPQPVAGGGLAPSPAGAEGCGSSCANAQLDSLKSGGVSPPAPGLGWGPATLSSSCRQDAGAPNPHPGLPPKGEGATPPPTFCHFAGDCLPGAPRVLAIATDLHHAGPPEQVRQHARDQARAALRQTLGYAWCCAPEALSISDQRGQPPRLGWAGNGAAPGALAHTRLSISHAPGLSLAVWCEQGCMGVDLQALPLQASRVELLRTAALFLPPNSVETLANQERDASLIEAFTGFWSAHEAALKCLGLALAEYHPALAARLAGVRTAALTLPGWATPDLVAALAWSPARP